MVRSLLSGIIRAGSVGLVLVAGLSFAAMSIGNQSTASNLDQIGLSGGDERL